VSLPSHRTYDRGGARPVLALHCSLAHAAAWAPLAAELQGVTLTAIDQPGHGRAPDWDGVSDIHRLYLDWAVAMAEALGGPLDVIGHSYGGTVALRLAEERPDLLRSLALIEPSIFIAAEGGPGFDDLIARLAPFHALLAEGKTAEAAALFQTVWGDGSDFADQPAGRRGYIIDRIGLIKPQSAFLEVDGAGLLRPGRVEAIKVPVLILRGAESPPVVAEVSAALAARLFDVQEVVVAGAAHMVPISHPAETAAAVQALLERA
jgi:lipase